MKTVSLVGLLTFPFLFLAFQKAPKQIVSLKDMKKAMKEGYCYVPSGKTRVEKDTVSVQGFFMMKGEVTNLNYLEYLYSLKTANRMDEYTAALPDTSVWQLPLAYGEPYVTYYFRHPAYRDYPVVGVSKAQAEKYCEWLTEVWRQKTGNNELVFRLPARAEFLRAANGSAMDRPYAWDGYFIRDAKGLVRCNHLALDNTSISRDPQTGELIVIPYPFSNYASALSSDITAPSHSYWPNEFGLFNLNGNVSEMVAEEGIAVGGNWNSPGYDVRNQSTEVFTTASSKVGFRPVMTFVESAD